VLSVRWVDGEEAVRRMRRAMDLGIILIHTMYMGSSQASDEVCYPLRVRVTRSGRCGVASTTSNEFCSEDN
jgi:hypothetical protein